MRTLSSMKVNSASVARFAAHGLAQAVLEGIDLRRRALRPRARCARHFCFQKAPRNALHRRVDRARLHETRFSVGDKRGTILNSGNFAGPKAGRHVRDGEGGSTQEAVGTRGVLRIMRS